MKKWIILFILPAFFLSACQKTEEKKEELVSSAKAVAQETTAPENLMMPQDTLYNRITREMEEQAAALRAQMTEEALGAIAETNSILQSVYEGDVETAEFKTKELIGKFAVLTAANPELSLLPVDAVVNVNETVTDLNTIQNLSKQVDEAVEKGYYQFAKKVLENLSSEVVISTTYIPLGTYPVALTKVGTLLKEGKLNEAAFLLEDMLGTIVIEEQALPLPVLKAQQLIIEVATLNTEQEDERALALNYLENADYQLKMAEALGYGKRNKDYKELYSSIKALKKLIVKQEAKEQIKASMEQLKKDISSFREKYFTFGKKDKK